MKDFDKCVCPDCGQPIEYPSEGTGQIVPCPSCKTPITLIPESQSAKIDSDTIPNEPQPIRMLKSECSHCFGGIEFSENGYRRRVSCPHCGQKTELGLNLFLGLDPLKTTWPATNEIALHKCAPAPTVEPGQESSFKQKSSFRRKRSPAVPLAKLTEDTIRSKTQTGDTPLHRAAKLGRIAEIPRHLLSIELFLIRNYRDETPIHVAARCGTLDKVPPEFLTNETMTTSTEYGSSRVYTNRESKTGPLPPRTESPMHKAVRYGHADQIPKQFVTPEFLSIQASGYRLTVLHQLAYANRLDLVPDIYANSEIWNMCDSSGQTPRDIVQAAIARKAYVARVRSEPATEKQKEKLRYFGCTFDANILKGEASDALDQCVRDFPEKEHAYYARPATEQQMAILRAHYGKTSDELDGRITYGEAKDMIWDVQMANRQEEEEAFNREALILYTARTDFFPSLTVSRVKKAAKALDLIDPDWIDEKGNHRLLLMKVAELNPELAEKDGWLRGLLRD